MTHHQSAVLGWNREETLNITAVLAINNHDRSIAIRYDGWRTCTAVNSFITAKHNKKNNSKSGHIYATATRSMGDAFSGNSIHTIETSIEYDILCL